MDRTKELVRRLNFEVEVEKMTSSGVPVEQIEDFLWQGYALLLNHIRDTFLASLGQVEEAQLLIERQIRHMEAQTGLQTRDGDRKIIQGLRNDSERINVMLLAAREKIRSDINLFLEDA